MSSAVVHASASLSFASRASISSKGRKVALPRLAKSVSTRSNKRGVVVKAETATDLQTSTESSTDLTTYEEGRDSDWNITYFPGMVNIESMIETIFFDGYNEKICVYAPGGAAEQMLLLPLIESIHTR